MKRYLVLLFLSISLISSAQTGIGWAQQRSKVNFKDSTNFEKDLKINSTWRIGLVTVTSTGTQLNYLSGATGITGSGSVVLSASPTLSGTVALGSGSLTMTGSIAATGSRVTKGWFTDLESTNVPTASGVALSRVYSDTMKVSAGVLRTKPTTITTDPYSVQIFNSSGLDITHAVKDSVALNGGVYKLYVYSVDALTGAKIKILY